MITLGEVKRMVLENTREWHREPYVEFCIRASIYPIVERCSWQAMRSTVSLSLADADDDTGLWLPSDVAGVDGVVDESSHIIYHGRDAKDEYDEIADETNIWFYSETRQEPLYSGMQLSIENRASSCTVADGGDLSETDGEYITIGPHSERFEITEVDGTTLSLGRTWRGETLSGDGGESPWGIRPALTRKLTVREGGEWVATRSLTVHIWRYPPLPYLPSDVILLPSADPLYWRTISMLVGETHADKERGDSFFSRYLNSLKQAMADNPTFSMPFAPKSRQGKFFRLDPSTRNQFTARPR